MKVKNDISKVAMQGDMAKFTFTTVSDDYDQQVITDMVHAFAEVLRTKGIHVVNAEFEPIVNQ